MLVPEPLGLWVFGSLGLWVFGSEPTLSNSDKLKEARFSTQMSRITHCVLQRRSLEKYRVVRASLSLSLSLSRSLSLSLSLSVFLH